MNQNFVSIVQSAATDAMNPTCMAGMTLVFMSLWVTAPAMMSGIDRSSAGCYPAVSKNGLWRAKRIAE